MEHENVVTCNSLTLNHRILRCCAKKNKNIHKSSWCPGSVWKHGATRLLQYFGPPKQYLTDANWNWQMQRHWRYIFLSKHIRPQISLWATTVFVWSELRLPKRHLPIIFFARYHILLMWQAKHSWHRYQNPTHEIILGIEKYIWSNRLSFIFV